MLTIAGARTLWVPDPYLMRGNVLSQERRVSEIGIPQTLNCYLPGGGQPQIRRAPAVAIIDHNSLE